MFHLKNYTGQCSFSSIWISFRWIAATHYLLSVLVSHHRQQYKLHTAIGSGEKVFSLPSTPLLHFRRADQRMAFPVWLFRFTPTKLALKTKVFVLLLFSSWFFTRRVDRWAGCCNICQFLDSAIFPSTHSPRTVCCFNCASRFIAQIQNKLHGKLIFFSLFRVNSFTLSTLLFFSGVAPSSTHVPANASSK